MDPSEGLGRTIGEISFIELMLAVVIGWMLVDLWVRAIENFAYGTLGMNKKSSYHALIVAATVTAIFVVYLSVSPQLWQEVEDSGTFAPI